MRNWKKTIWKVPLYCTVAGIIGFYPSIYLLQWALVRLPDGAITNDPVRTNIVYAALFLVTLLIGGLLFFRKLTRRELFCSASLLAVYGLVLLLIQRVFGLTTGPAAVWLLYLFRPFEMFHFPSRLLYPLIDNLWIISALQVLTPYCFVLFGRKSEAAA